MADITASLDGFALKDNTLVRNVKDTDADRIAVEVGDSKQPDFKPQVKLMRWDNEVNFSMRAQEDPTATVETVDGTVKYITKDYEVHQYEKPEASDDGGFEFEWVLPKKPVSNVLTATIQTKELDFFYQPALTEQEIAGGAQRPDNVVGSYAAYHKSKRDNRVGGKEYKTGKAFHIYRPEAIDANGERTWCDLYIDEQAGILTVTVPQKFLDGAVYPVKVDPTFGYTTAGESSSEAGGNDFHGTMYTSPSDFVTFQALNIHWSKASTTAFLGVITDPSLNIIPNGVSAASGAIGGSSGNYQCTFTTNPILYPGVNYILGSVHGSGGNSSTKYDTDASVTGYYDASNAYPTPTNPTDATTNTRKYSIYVTYADSTPTPTALYRSLSVTENGVTTSVDQTGAWRYGPWKQLAQNIKTPIYIYGLQWQETKIATADTTFEMIIEIGIGGVGMEVTKVQIPYSFRSDTAVAYYLVPVGRVFLPEPFYVPQYSTISVRTAQSAAFADTYNGIKLRYIGTEALVPPSVSNDNIENFKSVSAGDGISVSERAW